MTDIDHAFWERADKHIDLSNAQMSQGIKPGEVSASHMYSMARFAAFISFLNSENVEDLSEHKDEAISYFTDQFTKMLNENLDDYIENFDKYSR